MVLKECKIMNSCESQYIEDKRLILKRKWGYIFKSIIKEVGRAILVRSPKCYKKYKLEKIVAISKYY